MFDNQDTNESVEGNLKDKVNSMQTIMTAVIVVLFVAFSALLVSVIFSAGSWYATYSAEKISAQKELDKSLEEQNDLVERLILETNFLLHEIREQNIAQ